MHESEGRMFRLVPPAGTGLTIGDIARIKLKWLARAGNSPGFKSELSQLFDAKYVYPVNSGRAALYLILKTIQDTRSEGRNEVVLPAYTCYSVAASVIRSGFRIRLADIRPETMDYDFSSLEKQDISRVAAIVVSSLFGVPNDWPRLNDVARKNNIVLIDDAAQALGEESFGTAGGLHGTAGFYSLGRGKNMSTYSGGVIVTDDDAVGETLDGMLSNVSKSGAGASIGALYKMGLYSLLSRPRLFWLPAMLPFLGIGETVYEESFKVGRLSNAQSCAIPVVMKKLPRLRRIRIENSINMAKELEQIERLSIPGYSKKNCPAYIRLPIVMPDKKSRDYCIGILREKGIVASAMYPRTIGCIPELPGQRLCNPGSFPGAEEIVKRLVTVPTHPYVSAGDRDNIVCAIQASVKKVHGHDIGKSR